MISARPPRYANFSDGLNALIDDAVKKARDAQPRRTYLGGSTLGEPCLRKLGYSYAGVEQEPDRDGLAGFAGRIYRIFDRGHDGEERMKEYLRLAGFEMDTELPGGRQIGFAVAKDPETGEARMKGHIDGRINSGPAKIANVNLKARYPMLWENKIVRESAYKDLMKYGAREKAWGYFVQCQVYMAYMDLKWALFTAVNANTMEIYVELIELDLSVAQEASDRGVQVVTAASVEELPRAGADETSYICKRYGRDCEYKQRCWSKPAQPKDEGVSADWIAAQYK